LVYVLIIMLAGSGSGSGSAIGSIEFNSKHACEEAAKMTAESNRPLAGATAVTVCAAKG
jgi:hypothetical protein